MQGTITARSGMVSRSLRRKSTRKVWSSTTTNCSGLVERARAHLEGREAADRDGAVERPFHVLGGDRRAVVEGGVLLQLEGDRHVADVHVVGELHLELVAVVIGRAVRTGLHLVADEPVVAIPRHLVARHVGADAMDVDVVGPALGDDQQRFLARLRLGRRPDRGRRTAAPPAASAVIDFRKSRRFIENSPLGRLSPWKGPPQGACQIRRRQQAAESFVNLRLGLAAGSPHTGRRA